MIYKGPAPLLDRIEAVRRFDRFYERRITEAYRAAAVQKLTATELRVFRVLGEAADGRSGVWLNARLRIDPGYLSRILKKFQAHGFVMDRPWERDRRHREFALTDWGRRVCDSLDDIHRDRIMAALEELPERQQRRLVHAMKVIEEVLTRDPMENILEKCGVWRPRARS